MIPYHCTTFLPPERIELHKDTLAVMYRFDEAGQGRALREVVSGRDRRAYQAGRSKA